MKIKAITALLLYIVVGVGAIQVSAQDVKPYPHKPVRIVIPHPPGGNIDVLTRQVATRLSALWGQSVIVDNRPGGTGMSTDNIISYALPDGYTLLASAGAFRTAVPHFHPEQSRAEVSPIINFGEFPFLLAVHPSVPVKTTKELVVLARASPGGIMYGSSGPGSAAHLAAELFADVAGIKMLHVPYKGVALATTALIGGEIHLLWNSWGLLGPQVKSGRLRALGVGSEKRMLFLPDIPAISEQYPGYRSGSWAGLFAPVGTDDGKIDHLNKSVTSILEGEMKQYLTKEGVHFVPHSPRGFAIELANESLKNKKLIEQLRKSGKLE